MPQGSSLNFLVRLAVSAISIFLLTFSFGWNGGAMEARSASATLYVKPKASGSGDCSSWENACTLKTALIHPFPGDQIWVAAGVYKPSTTGDRFASFQLAEGVEVYGGFAGTESSLSERDWNTNVVLLSGDLNGDDQGFANNGENSVHVVLGAPGAILDGVTISGGNANLSSQDRDGGGMFNVNGSPTVSNVIFRYNTATDFGGGMYNYFSSPALRNITFSDNTADLGGGLANDQSVGLMLDSVTFNNNTADYGGGINNSNSLITLINATFSGNTARYGSGVANMSGTVMVVNSTFSGNTATEGGAIYSNYRSNTIVQNSILWGDTGSEFYNDLDPVVTVNNSIVQGGFPGVGIMSTDPLLTPLGDYGGEVPTMALLPNSPAMFGTAYYCPATDARGIQRFMMCDMGAFESQGFTIIKTSGDNQSTRVGAPFPQPLCVMVQALEPIEPVDGGNVVFLPPKTNPSANFIVNPAPIVDGMACTNATANRTVGGPYEVRAFLQKVFKFGDILFSLTNIPGIKTYLPTITK